MSQSVHAPYHFVPLSKWVYMPDWAHLVSHDVPFQDGLSGKIEYTLTNKTPLCVGDTKDESGVLKIARNPAGTPIIPGSSLKGMIRNVLEIASFGKFNTVDDRRFSFRDVSRDSHYLLDVIKPNKVIGGWLKYDADKQRWAFRQSEFTPVFHDDLNKVAKTHIFNESFKQPAEEKYQQYRLDSLKALSFDLGKQSMESTRSKTVSVECACNLGHGQLSGIPVFSGFRPGTKKYWSTRLNFSYLFYQAKPQDQAIAIDTKLVNDLFANHSEDLVKELRQHPHPELGIPVFALHKKGAIACFGFAKMPRVTYKNSIVELIERHNKAHTSDAYFDMAELMFGSLREKGFSLKSRVSFADAVAVDDCNGDVYQEDPTVLGSPQATFLGGYIEQDGKKSDNTYQSYDDDNARVSGWKRYPARKDYEHFSPENDNESVLSKFELLKPEKTFKGQITFHNLKPEELGALVWCLTLNNSDERYHSLGHAKPLGAGNVVIALDEATSFTLTHSGDIEHKINAASWSDRFSTHMNERYDPQGYWEKSPQMQHLLALTDMSVEDSNDFAYMRLEGYQSANNATLALPNLDINGRTLSRTLDDNRAMGSKAFARGRLSALFNGSDTFHLSEQTLSDQYCENLAKQQQKQQMAEEKARFNNADISPFDRICGLLPLMIESQDVLSSTDKKNKVKELREIIKEVKDIDLNEDEKATLISFFEQIELSRKDTDKAIKYLKK
ncbi:TPA: TIGR03986 family type III CRISPR-associated RAMP protein [Photobacterium damselae]